MDHSSPIKVYILNQVTHGFITYQIKFHAKFIENEHEFQSVSRLTVTVFVVMLLLFVVTSSH